MTRLLGLYAPGRNVVFVGGRDRCRPGGDSAMVTERGMTVTPGAVIRPDAEIEREPMERKRLFWLCWIGVFAAVGLASGAVALTVSLLTACRVILESQGLSIVVSALLVGCLASFLLSAHGMDRLASMRMRTVTQRRNFRK